MRRPFAVVLLSALLATGLGGCVAAVIPVGAAAVLDHYDMVRSEWYIGPAGIVLFGLGSVMSFLALLPLMLGLDWSDGDGGNGGNDGDGGGGDG